MTDEITILLDYHRAEYIRGVRFYLRRTGMMGPLGIALFLVMAAVEVFLLWLAGTTFVNTAVLVLLVIAIGMGVFLYLVQPGRVFDKTPRFRECHRVTFSAEDIGMQNGEAAALLAWSFCAFWRTKEFYFLIQDKESYTILPRRVFTGTSDEAHFEKIVKMAIPNIKYKDL